MGQALPSITELLKNRPDLGIEVVDLGLNYLSKEESDDVINTMEYFDQLKSKLIKHSTSPNQPIFNCLALGVIDKNLIRPEFFFDSNLAMNNFSISSNDPLLYTQVLYIDQEKWNKLDPTQTLRQRLDYRHFILYWLKTRGQAGVYELRPEDLCL